MDHLERLVIGLENKGFPVDVRVKSFTAKHDREHFSFYIGISLFTITERLAGERYGSAILDKDCTESSAGCIDLDNTLLVGRSTPT